MTGSTPAGTWFLFPSLHTNGDYHPADPTDRNFIDKLFQRLVFDADLLEGRFGTFTLGCFRRGGAQHGFLPLSSSLSSFQQNLNAPEGDYPHPSGSPSLPPTPPSLPITPLTSGRPQLIPTARSPADVLSQWEFGNPSAGLQTPLKDWSEKEQKEESRASLYGRRKDVWRLWEKVGEEEWLRLGYGTMSVGKLEKLAAEAVRVPIRRKSKKMKAAEVEAERSRESSGAA
ncbi:hypothetical protein BDY24DRAFT_107510 [Mrakia frigida]|uniref:uncharacterized protein n=1 Tax=Mrakia frigida TaxID=29902 RepID=UPI003FCBF10F